MIKDWNKLKYFYDVAKAGSFTLASKKLNLCQSALSRKISQLESDLGAKLFERLPHGLILTKVGEILYHSTDNIQLEAKTADILISEETQKLSGPLRALSPY